MTKRNTENRHLLRFSTLAHEIGEFLEEYGQGLTLVHFSAQHKRFVCDRECI